MIKISGIPKYWKIESGRGIREQVWERFIVYYRILEYPSTLVLTWTTCQEKVFNSEGEMDWKTQHAGEGERNLNLAASRICQRPQLNEKVIREPDWKKEDRRKAAKFPKTFNFRKNL